MRTVCVFLALFSGLLQAQTGKRAPRGEPGKFDYYVLALSWSPSYCAGQGAADPVQCGPGKRFGFVVHGLWPQFEKGYPQFCAPASKVPQATVDRMLPLMPSRKLIQHEWDKHGTCSGLAVADYFELAAKARTSVAVPEAFTAPLKQLTYKPAAVYAKFAEAGVARESIRLRCSGRFVSEVHVCMDKDLGLRRCAADVKDTCAAAKVIFRPVR